MDVTAVDGEVIAKLKTTVNIYEEYLRIYAHVIIRRENRSYDDDVISNYRIISTILLELPMTKPELRFDSEFLLLQQHIIETTAVYISRMFLYTFAAEIYWVPMFELDLLPGSFDDVSRTYDIKTHDKIILLELITEWQDRTKAAFDYLKNKYQENRLPIYHRTASSVVSIFITRCEEAVKLRGLDEELAKQFIRLIIVIKAHLDYEFHEIAIVEGAQLFSRCCMRCLKQF